MSIFIFILLFAVGIVRFEKQDFECLGRWQYKFGEKVEVVRIRWFVVNAYPLRRECPADLQYDPEDLQRFIIDEGEAVKL